MPELRKDPILGRWVIIASERTGRPSDFKPEATFSDDVSKCPFCPGNEAKTPPEILAYNDPGREPNTKGWWLRVIPNKYPALDATLPVKRMGEGMYDQMSGTGTHEVIIETPDHFGHIADMPDKMAADIFWSFRDRMMELKKDPRFRYVLIFKNYGRKAGATLSHPHCQLIALPMVPIRVQQEMDGALGYFRYKERCVYCDMVREEQRFGKRVVDENERFIAIEPYASRSPFETWIIPKEHAGHFEKIDETGVAALAAMMKSVLGKMKRLLKDPSYNFIIHSTPMHEAETAHYHWHLEIMPKLTHVAGFEWGSGFYINPTPPESAAEMLRNA